MPEKKTVYTQFKMFVPTEHNYMYLDFFFADIYT